MSVSIMQEKVKTVLQTIFVSLLVLTLMGGAAAANPDAAMAEKIGALPGYLTSSDYPDNLKLLPPPPAPVPSLLRWTRMLRTGRFLCVIQPALIRRCPITR